MSHVEYYANTVIASRLREAAQARRRAAARGSRQRAVHRPRWLTWPRIRLA